MEMQMYELDFKSQKLNIKKIKILFFLLLFTQIGLAQEYESYLKNADSLTNSRNTPNRSNFIK